MLHTVGWKYKDSAINNLIKKRWCKNNSGVSFLNCTFFLILAYFVLYLYSPIRKKYRTHIFKQCCMLHQMPLILQDLFEFFALNLFNIRHLGPCCLGGRPLKMIVRFIYFLLNQTQCMLFLDFFSMSSLRSDWHSLCHLIRKLTIDYSVFAQWSKNGKTSAHSSQFQGLCSMKSSSETLQNLPYFTNENPK